MSVRMLGEFELGRADQRPMPLGSARMASLLAYLLLNRSPQSRQRLAFLLWPDSIESQARTNLRHLLHELRRSIPDVERFIEIGADALHWRRLVVHTQNQQLVRMPLVIDPERWHAGEIYRGFGAIHRRDASDVKWLASQR